MSDHKAPGRRPNWDCFQTVSAPPVTLQYICLPEDWPRPREGRREALPFQKEPQPALTAEGCPCELGKSQGFQLRAPYQPWYAGLGSVPTQPAPTCPEEEERPGKDGKGVAFPPPPSSSQLKSPLKF